MLAGAVTLPARAADELKVTLLGTGSPNPQADRFSMSTLVEAGETRLLIDAGRGSSIRLWQLGVSLGSIDAVFLTHFHLRPHHRPARSLARTVGSARRMAAARRRSTVVGPIGTMDITEPLFALAYAPLMCESVIADEHLPAAGARFDTREFSGDGKVVFEHAGPRSRCRSRWTMVPRSNRPTATRRELQGSARSCSPATRGAATTSVKHAAGVDLLIHEVATANDQALAAQSPASRTSFAHHVTPAEAASIFNAVKPKLAVYSHLVFLSDTKFPAADGRVPNRDRHARHIPGRSSSVRISCR